jgi:signal transduction histidine kinase
MRGSSRIALVTNGLPSVQRRKVKALGLERLVDSRLSQSQKMEAVGRLAGGLAHDFNNLLTIIGGQAERLHQELPVEHELRRSAEAVLQAADRAAGLTQQLLAFSRRQVLAPRVLGDNDLVAELAVMLAEDAPPRHTQRPAAVDEVERLLPELLTLGGPRPARLSPEHMLSRERDRPHAGDPDPKRPSDGV